MATQSVEIANSITPRHGVVTLFGYGIRVRVDRGHLILNDGIGADRREARFPRVGHGLRRLVVIGADGMVSLAALRWLADQEADSLKLRRLGGEPWRRWLNGSLARFGQRYRSLVAISLLLHV